MPTPPAGDLKSFIAWLEERLYPNTPVHAVLLDELVVGYQGLYGKWKKGYKSMPNLEVVAQYVRILRAMLEEHGHPLARTTNVPRALMAAGLMTEEDLAQEKATDIDLSVLTPRDQDALLSFYAFLREACHVAITLSPVYTR